MLASVEHYMDLWDTRRDDLDAETRFKLVWGEVPAMRAGVPLWVEQVYRLVNLDLDAVSLEHQLDVLLYIIERMMRDVGHSFAGEDAVALSSSGSGEVSIVDAVRKLPPRTWQPLPGPAPQAARPVVEVFVELEAHAAKRGVTMTMQPYLTAAAHPDAPRPPDFELWHRDASELVADDEGTAALATTQPMLHGRKLDMLIYLLEATSGRYEPSDEILDGLLTGTVDVRVAMR